MLTWLNQLTFGHILKPHLLENWLLLDEVEVTTVVANHCDTIVLPSKEASQLSDFALFFHVQMCFLWKAWNP